MKLQPRPNKKPLKTWQDLNGLLQATLTESTKDGKGPSAVIDTNYYEMSNEEAIQSLREAGYSVKVNGTFLTIK
ncbi:hypothetical protein [Pediococcus inopinatus]|uniref:hypothetical protein n=1 Tax=Pediococcus inopinatus TaxID=114090 RepID=UPI002B25B4F9|nr:hypothetical protein [Pediococcus inopinatus]WPC19479.1 hypothetical protein N6G95_09710 [Pediococcus inopinatus]